MQSRKKLIKQVPFCFEQTQIMGAFWFEFSFHGVSLVAKLLLVFSQMPSKYSCVVSISLVTSCLYSLLERPVS